MSLQKQTQLNVNIITIIAASGVFSFEETVS